MTNVPKHNSKHKREEHYCEESGVDLLVPGHAVGVDYFLESPCELVDLEVCGYGEVLRWFKLNDLSWGYILFLTAKRLECLVDLKFSGGGAPEEAGVDGVLEMKGVEVVVDCLFPYHDKATDFK